MSFIGGSTVSSGNTSMPSYTKQLLGQVLLNTDQSGSCPAGLLEIFNWYCYENADNKRHDLFYSKTI